jgi:hypothetical protein
VPATRAEGATNFSGMDSSLAETAPAFDRAVLDVGSNHEKAGGWRTRRGFTRGFAQVGGAVTLVKCWEAENETTACLIAATDGYYSADPFPTLTTGYGTGGYGSQVYGD